MVSISPFSATHDYLELVKFRENEAAVWKKLGLRNAATDALEHPESDPHLQRLKRAAEREQTWAAEGNQAQPVTVNGQLPASITNAMVKGTDEAARLGDVLQKMIGNVAQVNHEVKATSPQAAQDLLQHMDQAHADVELQNRKEWLKQLHPEEVEGMGAYLRSEGFTVTGALFQKAADGTYELGEATISGKGVTLGVSGKTGFTLRLDGMPDVITGAASSASGNQPPPTTMPDAKPAADTMRAVDKALDQAFARMDTHNALVTQLKPENIAAMAAAKGDKAAEAYRQDLQRKLAQLNFDPQELAPKLAAQGLDFDGTLAEKQTDGSYAAGHFLINGTMPGGSGFAYDSIAGAYLRPDGNGLYKLPSKDRTATPTISLPRTSAVA